MSDDNLTLLPTEPNPMLGALESVKRNWDMHMEFWTLDAKVKRAKYEALIAVGFKPEEALLLIRGT